MVFPAGLWTGLVLDKVLRGPQRAVETPPHLPSKQPAFADLADRGLRKAWCGLGVDFRVVSDDGI